MISLSGEDGFVIFRDPNSKKNKLSLGEWELINSKFEITKTSFICNIFNDDSYILNNPPRIIEDEIIIRQPSFFDEKNISKTEYQTGIDSVIKLCQHKIIEKCIISRIIKVNYESNNYYKIFKELCEAYEDGFKYILNHPKFGMWIGISPETLISGNKEKGYYTHALAGSKLQTDSSKWSEKEIEEHQYVVKYIEEKIKNSGTITNKSKVYEKIAGNLKHLNKDFKFTLKKSYLKFLNTLHPTPAIAGIPLEKSLEIIKQIESHQRSLYCGFIGIVDENSCDLFVNLRCGRISLNEIQLFVGGGITKKSIADQEYEETEIKSQTLLSIIKKI